MIQSFVAVLALLLVGAAQADHPTGPCPTDVSGSWQVTSSCGAAGSVASVSEITVASTATTCLYDVTLEPGPATIDIPGLGPLSAVYSASPNPFDTHVIDDGGNGTTETPATGGTYGILVTLFPPFPLIPSVGCGNDSVVQISLDSSGTGVITEATGTVATEIETSADHTNVTFFKAGPVMCGSAPDDTCSGILLRNGVGVGTNVPVTPTPGVTLTFDDVTGAGTVVVGVKTTSPSPLPPNFKLSGLFFEITTDATFNPQVEICITYEEEPAGFLKGTGTPESAIRLYHDSGSGWDDVTVLPVDDVNNVVCGRVDSFSFVAVVGAQPAVPALSTGSTLLVLSALLATGIGWMRMRRR